MNLIRIKSIYNVRHPSSIPLQDTGDQVKECPVGSFCPAGTESGTENLCPIGKNSLNLFLKILKSF